MVLCLMIEWYFHSLGLASICPKIYDLNCANFISLSGDKLDSVVFGVGMPGVVTERFGEFGEFAPKVGFSSLKLKWLLAPMGGCALGKIFPPNP